MTRRAGLGIAVLLLSVARTGAAERVPASPVVAAVQRSGDPAAPQGRPQPLGNRLEDRWNGTWVVTATETFSDCAGTYTGNDVSGTRVESRGSERFEAGIPARIDSVEMMRDGLKVRMTLSINMMMEREHRDFTLRALSPCRAEMRVLLPPDVRRGDDDGALYGVEAILAEAFERQADERSAILASNFLPQDDPQYAVARGEVLARQQEQRAAVDAQAVEARLEQWRAETSLLSRQISQDPDYLAGFGRGVETQRTTAPSTCSDVMHMDPSLAPVRADAGAAFAAKGGRQKVWARGFEDGVRLTQGLEALRVLPTCMPEEQPAPHASPAPAAVAPVASGSR
jgi:hypothetical protein